ncbi:hypothetical protein Tco_0713197 [Tanacetum coccineum]
MGCCLYVFDLWFSLELDSGGGVGGWQLDFSTRSSLFSNRLACYGGLFTTSLRLFLLGTHSLEVLRLSMEYDDLVWRGKDGKEGRKKEKGKRGKEPRKGKEKKGAKGGGGKIKGGGRNEEKDRMGKEWGKGKLM